MDFLRDWFGKKVSIANPQEFVLADGAFTVSVSQQTADTHDGSIEMAVFASSGLPTVGQQDIIICYSSRAGSIPQKVIDELLKLFNSFYHLALQGMTVQCGGFTGFRDKILGFAGLLYVNAEIFAFLSNTKNKLLALFIGQEAFTATVAFGVTRVAAALGRINHFYPTPVWTLIKRDPGWMAKMNQKSPLGMVPGINLPSACATLSKQEILMEIKSVDLSEFLEDYSYLPENTPFYIKTHYSIQADGCLTWSDDGVLEAITPHGSEGKKLTGAFISFIPFQEEDNIKLVEDGFFMSCTDQTYQKIVDALSNKTPLQLPLQGEFSSFTLRIG